MPNVSTVTSKQEESEMKQGVFLKRAIASVIAALAAGQFSTQTAQAQVLAIGPNGQLGYVTTPAPISPDCIPPQIWTLTNGHYSCQNPTPPQQAQPQPKLTAAEACQIVATNNGFQNIQGYTTYYGNYPYAGGVAVADVL
jgi:hypothetical protein